MNYFTAMASSPVYEFPYSGYQAQSLPNFDNDINALLSNITPSLGVGVYNQPASPTITLQCVPQINPGVGVGNNTIVYEVPETTSIDAILQQLGINTNTLQPSSTLNNYYRSASQPMEIFLPPSSYPRRRLVCHEVSDSDDDNRYRHSPHHHRHRRSSAPDQAPMAIHDLLSRVWDKARRGSRDLPSSSSAPNLDSQWQAMRNSPPPPPNVSVNNVWQAIRNSPPPMSPDHRDAVSNVWQKANSASDQNANRLSNIFNRMRQPMGNIVQPPTPPPQNREAVQNFLAARNLPYGINLPPPQQPNREAVQDFFAARNLPYGINLPPPQQPNREAVQNFFAARNLPYGVNSNPAVANVWNRAGYAANQLPPPPQPNQEAVQNFLAARNLPYGINPNPAVANVWNRVGSAANQPPPPMSNASWNQMPPPSSLPPMNTTWNRMQQGSPLPPPSMNTSWNPMPQGSPLPLNPSYMNPPYGGPQRVPAPSSFASLLSQAHRQNLPYAGAV